MRKALISVSDKSNLGNLLPILKELNFEIISSGGTAKKIREFGFEVKDVSDYTGYPESPEGLVKTLHPKVHGGLLLDENKEDHKKYTDKNEIFPFDLVIVNLYPFEETIQKPDVTLTEAVENIDIGGPSMVRSAAKGALLHNGAAIVTNPEDYELIANELKENKVISIETKKQLAKKAFEHTANYDKAIINYLKKVI